MDTSTKLVKAKDEDTFVVSCGKSVCCHKLSVMWLSFVQKPTKQHWIAVKRIFRYLKGTQKYGLLFKTSTNKDCVGFSDADWGGVVTWMIASLRVPLISLVFESLRMCTHYF